MRLIAILCSAFTLGAICCRAAIAAETEQALIDKGRALALSVCAPCHVVSPGQPPEGPLLKNPGPSFDQIANSDTADADSLKVFLASPHASVGPEGRMANPRLADYQIERLVAYIMSLRRTK